MIEFDRVTKSYIGRAGGRVEAVRDLSLCVAAGEVLCIVGPSGCGKSTTLRMINRLIEPSSGRVRFDGRDVAEQDVIRLRRRIGYVTQGGGLFPHRTVRRNVGLLCALEGWERERLESRVDALLNLVDLAPARFGDRYPRELSGGQRQRVSVARSLALEPATVLMDEPFGALDPLTRGEIHQQITALRERGALQTAVIVTHDLAEAFKLGDRVALMREGQLAFAGDRAGFEAHEAPFVRDFVARSEMG